jgi:hypothetical protein
MAQARTGAVDDMYGRDDGKDDQESSDGPPTSPCSAEPSSFLEQCLSGRGGNDLR